MKSHRHPAVLPLLPACFLFLAVSLALFLTGCAARHRTIMKLALHQPPVNLVAHGVRRLAILDLEVPQEPSRTPEPQPLPSLRIEDPRRGGLRLGTAAIAGRRTPTFEESPPIPAEAGARFSDALQERLAHQLAVLADRKVLSIAGLADRTSVRNAWDPTVPGDHRWERLARQLDVQAFLTGQLLEYGVRNTDLQQSGDGGYRLITRQARVTLEYQVRPIAGNPLWSRTVSGMAEASWVEGINPQNADPWFLERLSAQGKRLLNQRRPDEELLNSAINQAVIDVLRDIIPYYSVKEEELR